MHYRFVSSSADCASLAVTMGRVMAPRGVEVAGVVIEGSLAPTEALRQVLDEVGLPPAPVERLATDEPGTWVLLDEGGTLPPAAPTPTERWALPGAAGAERSLDELRVVRELVREHLRQLFARRLGPSKDLDDDPWRVRAREGALRAAGAPLTSSGGKPPGQGEPSADQ